MARLFVSNAGKVGVVAAGGLPAIITIAGFNPSAMIVTNVGFGQAANVQIQPSLQNTIFVYSFGDAMGAVRIGGIAFIAEMCAGGAGQRGDGVKELMEFYSANRVSRTLSHVNVTIGATVFSGFLMRMGARTQDAEKRFFTWELELAAIPNFEGLASGAVAAAADEEDPAAEESIQNSGNNNNKPSGNQTYTSDKSSNWKGTKLSGSSTAYTYKNVQGNNVISGGVDPVVADWAGIINGNG